MFCLGISGLCLNLAVALNMLQVVLCVYLWSRTENGLDINIFVDRSSIRQTFLFCLNRRDRTVVVDFLFGAVFVEDVGRCSWNYQTVYILV